LSAHNMQTIELNRRFAFSFEPTVQSKKLLMLGKGKPSSKKGPSTAIDYSNAEALYRSRLFIEISTTAVVFGARFIPLVGGYIKSAFVKFVESPADDAKVWEARLTVALEANDSQAYASDLAVIDKQRINPFYPSRTKMNELIQKRKDLLGLP